MLTPPGGSRTPRRGWPRWCRGSSPRTPSTHCGTRREQLPPGLVDDQHQRAAVHRPGAHLVHGACSLRRIVKDQLPGEHVAAHGRQVGKACRGEPPTALVPKGACRRPQRRALGERGPPGWIGDEAVADGDLAHPLGAPGAARPGFELGPRPLRHHRSPPRRPLSCCLSPGRGVQQRRAVGDVSREPGWDRPGVVHLQTKRVADVEQGVEGSGRCRGRSATTRSRLGAWTCLLLSADRRQRSLAPVLGARAGRLSRRLARRRCVERGVPRPDARACATIGFLSTAGSP